MCVAAVSTSGYTVYKLPLLLNLYVSFLIILPFAHPLAFSVLLFDDLFGAALHEVPEYQTYFRCIKFRFLFNTIHY